MQAKPPRTAAEQALIDRFSAILGDLPGDAKVTSARDRLAGALADYGLPSRRIETWHYTDLRTLLRAIPDAATAPADARDPLVHGTPVLALLNGEAQEARLPEGFSAEPFFDRLASGEATAALTAERGDAIGLLNGTFVTDGFVIETGSEGGIVELQCVQGGGHAHTRNAVTIRKGAPVTVLERQINAGTASFATTISDLVLEEGAEATWVVVQTKGVNDIHLARTSVTLAADAKLKLFVINAGGKLVRHELHVAAAGEGAHLDLRGINLLAGDSHTDLTLELGHNVANTTSSEIVRNVVFDRARGVFQGQIRVARDAQKTDAQMACNTLLLSDEGEFAAKPELEIFADDVICAHGATVADLDGTHLFYLMARGIPERSARALLVNGFVDELVDELEDEALVEVLEAFIEQWLADHA